MAAPATACRAQRLKNDGSSSFGRKVECLFFDSVIRIHRARSNKKQNSNRSASEKPPAGRFERSTARLSRDTAPCSA